MRESLRPANSAILEILLLLEIRQTLDYVRLYQDSLQPQLQLLTAVVLMHVKVVVNGCLVQICQRCDQRVRALFFQLVNFALIVQNSIVKVFRHCECLLKFLLD